MKLAIRDLNIESLRQELQCKQKFMLDKQKELERTKNENAYLIGVAEDYTTYKNHLINQKREQLRALLAISNYISETSRNIDMSEHLLHQSRMEQSEILADIERIKAEINELL